MKFADFKFRNQLLLTLLCTLIPMVLVGTLIGYFWVKNIFENSIENHLNASLHALVSLVRMSAPEEVEKIIHSFETGDTGYGFVINEKGQVIAHPLFNEDGNLTRTRYAAGLFARMKDKKSGMLTYSWQPDPQKEAIQKLAVFQSLEKHKWIVAYTCDKDSIYAPLSAFIRFLVSIVLLISGFMVGGAFIISSYITRPLEKMVGTLEKGGEGDYTIRMKETGPEEFAVLSRHFNAFIKRLEENAREIETAIQKNIDSQTALVENDLKLRSLFDQSFQYMGILSPSGVVEQINQSSLDSVGCTAEDVLYLPFWETIWWQHDPQVKAAMEDGVQKAMKGKFVRFETTSISKDQQVREIDISIKPVFQENGQIAFIITEGRDITRYKQTSRERKNLAVQLERAQKMEALGTLAGGIAHDFNNILSGILGHTQLLEIAHTNSGNISSHINQISNGVRRAAELTHQILTFSRETEYEKQPLELRLVVKEVLKLIRSSIPTTIEIQSDIQSKAVILADPTQMHQVIMNLCTNAYHAMLPDGGTLFVSLADEIFPESRDVFGHTFAPGHYLELVIRDTGHGMDKETVAKSFDPYFTTKEEGKGTGLGLALVHAIVEEHHGYIQVHTASGKGTCFFIRVPVVKRKQGKKVSQKVEKTLAKGNESIMVVDDEAAIRRVIKRFLENLGYQVSCFSDALKALEAFQSDPEKFDLVITDMTMPKMTGDRLSEELLRLKPELPIILCTGYSENASEKRILKMGVKRFAEKPVDNALLSVWIRELLDHSS